MIRVRTTKSQHTYIVSILRLAMLTAAGKIGVDVMLESMRGRSSCVRALG